MSQMTHLARAQYDISIITNYGFSDNTYGLLLEMARRPLHIDFQAQLLFRGQLVDTITITWDWDTHISEVIFQAGTTD